MKGFLLLPLWVALSGAYASEGFAQDDRGDRSRAAHSRLAAERRRIVIVLENELARKLWLHAQRSASREEVDALGFKLAAAEHDLALSQRQRAAMLEQLHVMIRIRERQLERWQRLRSQRMATENPVLAARRRLAYARYRLAIVEQDQDAIVHQLGLVVDCCAQEVHLLRKDRACDADVNAAVRRLAYARYRLARAEGRSAEVLQHLRVCLEVRQVELKSVQKLRVDKAVSLYEVHVAHFWLIQARVRLAITEKKSTEVIEQLRRLVNLGEEIQQMLPTSGDATLQFVAIREETAHARYRLEVVAYDLTLVQDDPAAELDS